MKLKWEFRSSFRLGSGLIGGVCEEGKGMQLILAGSDGGLLNISRQFDHSIVRRVV